MKDIIARAAKLIDVKSVVTILFAVTLVCVTLRGLPVPDLFANAVMLVLGFFFGKNLNNKTEGK